MRLSPTPERSPAVEPLLADALARPRRGLAGRELRAEALVGLGFAAAAVALVVLGGADGRGGPTEALLVFVGLLLASRVRFEVGSCYTMPLQLAFVPALFVLPPELAPALVGAALISGRATESAQGELHPSRILNALGDSWFSLGPALVLAAAGAPEADAVGALTLVGALAAQFAVDLSASAVRERLHGGVGVREQLAALAWVWSVDGLLAPLGFALALAATIEPAAVALSWPVFLLLSVFARERDERLASLLELSEAYRGTARVLGEVVERDDAYTGAHIRGVAEVAVEIAADLGLDPRRRRLVEFGALLHDVGKIAIPNEIINKPAPLDETEWSVIRTHTVEGQRMLDRIGGLMRDVGQVVRSSHERWDGTGYPDGLAGEEIPIESRIVFCCDAFNAMTTDRAYRTALSLEGAVAELRANSGSQFDPAVVAALLARIERARPDPRAGRSLEHPRVD